jgi:hypothetical protein
MLKEEIPVQKHLNQQPIPYVLPIIINQGNDRSSQHQLAYPDLNQLKDIITQAVSA